MTRTLTCASVFLLLALLLVPACPTTDRRPALTLSIADIAADMAILAANHGSGDTGGISILLGCEVGGAFKQVSVETSEPQLVAPADSTRKVEADGVCPVWNAQEESVSAVGTLSLRGLTGCRVQYALTVPGVPALPVSLKRGCNAFLVAIGGTVGASDFRT